MHLLSTNLYFYMEEQICTCVWNVLIPKTLKNLFLKINKVNELKIILKYKILCTSACYAHISIVEL